MIENELDDILDAILKPMGCQIEPGEDYERPPLDIRRYGIRPVKLHWLPYFGKGLSITAVVRQPTDCAFSSAGFSAFLKRLAMAVNGRYPPRLGAVAGLTIVMLTSDPILPTDEEILKLATRPLLGLRVVPLGAIRLNLAQEAMAFSFVKTSDDLFPEGVRVADGLGDRFRRYLPLLNLDVES